MLTALSTFAFTAPSGTIDSTGDAVAIGKDDTDIRTRLTVFAQFDPRNDAADNRSFLTVQTTDPLAAAVIAREAIWGRFVTRGS